MSELLNATVEVPEHVVHREFPNETVVLNLQTGMYHGLNRVAGRMLQELQNQATVGAAANLIAAESGHAPADVERDICELCLQLSERGLISLAYDPS